MRFYLNFSDKCGGSDGSFTANFLHAFNSVDDLLESVQVVIAFCQAPYKGNPSFRHGDMDIDRIEAVF